MSNSNPVTQLRALALLSAAAPPREELERIVDSLDPLSWASIISAARRHCLLPLIHGNLSRSGLLENIPAEAASALRNSRASTAAMNMLLLELRDRVSTAASLAGVPLMPLKGAYLIGKYYQPEERPMTDIDFLAPPGRAADARSIMIDLGFVSEQGQRLRGEFEEKYSGEEKFKITIAGTAASVEIHTGLLPTEPLRRAFPLRPESLWDNAAQDEHGRPLPCLEHALLFGALHMGPVHCFSRLMWLADTDRMLRGGGIRWEFLSEESSRARASALMHHTLRAAKRLYDSPIPGNLEMLFPSPAKRIPGEKIDQWFSSGQSLRGSALIPCLLSENPAAYILRHLFPPPAYLMSRHGVPAWKLPAYYIARPFSLAAGAKGLSIREKKTDK